MKAAEQRHLVLPPAQDFQAIAGHGVEGIVDGRVVLLGNRKLLQEWMISSEAVQDSVECLEQEGKTVMFVAVDRQLAGVIAVADTVKEAARDAVAQLKRMGIVVYLLTGDNQRTARPLHSR